MLETIREFALERLEESGEDAAVNRRHALAAVQLAETAEHEMPGLSETSWLVRLDREHDNLRAALRWCETHGYAEPALRIAVALWWFWGVRGHLREGREHLTSLVERFPIKPTSPRAGLYARALSGAGVFASVQGDHAVARSLLERGWRSADDRRSGPASASGLGQVVCLQGTLSPREHLEEALVITHDLGDTMSEAYVLHALGNVSYGLGDLPRARTYYEDAVALAGDAVEYGGMLAATHAIALVAHEQGASVEAHALASQALALSAARRSSFRRSPRTGRSSWRAATWRRPVHLVESITLQQELGDAAAIAVALGRFVELRSQGFWEDALRLAAARHRCVRSRLCTAADCEAGPTVRSAAVGRLRGGCQPPGSVATAPERAKAVAAALASTDMAPLPGAEGRSGLVARWGWVGAQKRGVVG
jgi:hypothetical protein